MKPIAALAILGGIALLGVAMGKSSDAPAPPPQPPLPPLPPTPPGASQGVLIPTNGPMGLPPFNPPGAPALAVPTILNIPTAPVEVSNTI